MMSYFYLFLLRIRCNKGVLSIGKFVSVLEWLKRMLCMSLRLLKGVYYVSHEPAVIRQHG